MLEISPFEEKIFECLTIEIMHKKKKSIVSNIYRTPASINSNLTSTFITALENHLENISQLGASSYIFLDSNLNLFKLNDSDGANKYFNTILSAGFKQVIKKATRILGITYSLIDHVLVNANLENFESGTLLSDISDHFITFISPDTAKFTQPPKNDVRRNFSETNLNNFKTILQGCNWANVLACNDVDACFEIFWTEFKSLFDLCFPETPVKFNKNIHKIRDYMTRGLLISRSRKTELHKKSLANPSPENLQVYRAYRNIFNSLMRLSKKLYFDNGFRKFKKNPKKSWDLLKEATFGTKNKSEINEIMVNNKLTADPREISENFNNFFTSVGEKIFESVSPVDRPPDLYQSEQI